MGFDQRVENRQMARVVEKRAGVGPAEIVSVWQAVIVDLPSRMKSFLMPGVTVTFQYLALSEIIFFERLKDEMRIPQSAAAIYLPPSVRKQMLGEKQVINGDS